MGTLKAAAGLARYLTSEEQAKLQKYLDDWGRWRSLIDLAWYAD